MKSVILIGYSGHAYVAIDIILSNQMEVAGYCEMSEKDENPYGIPYLGDESQDVVIKEIAKHDYFVGIGEHPIRAKITGELTQKLFPPISIVHTSAVVAPEVLIGKGVMVAANSTINPMAQIGDGVICNTGSIIEHECKVGAYSHIAPGSVLLGKVNIGAFTIVGSNSVILPGITVGDNVIIGAGSVVLHDIPDNTTVVGNPAKPIKP